MSRFRQESSDFVQKIRQRISQCCPFSGGLDFPAITAGALASLRDLGNAGNRVIFDTKLSTPEAAAELMNAFRSPVVASVAITCEWEEIERRTIQRGDRTIEEARAGFEATMKHLPYDVTVDTTTKSPEETDRQINRELSAV